MTLPKVILNFSLTASVFIFLFPDISMLDTLGYSLTWMESSISPSFWLPWIWMSEKRLVAYNLLMAS